MGINVTSTIEINVFALEELTEIGKQALQMAADAVMTQVKNTEVMPFDSGTMQNDNTTVIESNVQNGSVQIVTTGPQARRLYYHPEYNFHREPWVDKQGRRHGGNKFAGGRWFEPWMPKGSRREYAAQAFQIFYRRLLRNALHG